MSVLMSITENKIMFDETAHLASRGGQPVFSGFPMIRKLALPTKQSANEHSRKRPMLDWQRIGGARASLRTPSKGPGPDRPDNSLACLHRRSPRKRRAATNRGSCYFVAGHDVTSSLPRCELAS